MANCLIKAFDITCFEMRFNITINPNILHVENLVIHSLKDYYRQGINNITEVQDRILKAIKMSNMVLLAIGHNKNVFVKLALSLFDKQIIPILLYGAAIWSLPDTQNILYLLDQPEDTCYNTRQLSRLPSQTQWAEMCRMNMQGAWGRDPMPVIEKLSFVFIASRTEMKFWVVVKKQRMSLWILILSPLMSWKTAWRRYILLIWKRPWMSLSLPATCVCIVNSLFFIMPGHWP